VRAGQEPGGTAGRILLVDDESAPLVQLEGLLRRAGYWDIWTADQPDAALAVVEGESPDLLLLEVHPPHLEQGLGLLAALAERGGDRFLPVVVITADNSPAIRHRALQLGAADFLAEPLDGDEVLLRVRNLLIARRRHETLRRQNVDLLEQILSRAEHEEQTADLLRERRERIEDVLAGHRFHIVFQPIIDLATGRPRGAEALTRFDSGELSGPAEWFAEASAVGLGTELEMAAAGTALRALEDLPPSCYLSLNVSPETAISGRVESLLGEEAPARIVLELTEHTRVSDYSDLVGGLLPLRQLGARVAVDDAGSGFASLEHVLQLSPDIIKLDRILIHNVATDAARRAMITSLVTFAHEVGAVLVAEGIETAEELGALRRLKVDCGQGFYLARPAREVPWSGES
jgi:EAL domain-containing protein (putative c-di-GMP-specific phosphodiesterase class I)